MTGIEKKSYIDDFDTAKYKVLARQLPPGTAGLDGPVPDASSQPTEHDLAAATDLVITLEQLIIEANTALDEIMTERVELFARYSAAYVAAGDGQDQQFINESMQNATQYSDLMYREWTSFRDLVQSYLSVWTAARAKIEHDIAWQAYMAEQHGVTDIERAAAAAALDLKAAA